MKATSRTIRYGGPLLAIVVIASSTPSCSTSRESRLGTRDMPIRENCYLAMANQPAGTDYNPNTVLEKLIDGVIPITYSIDDVAWDPFIGSGGNAKHTEIRNGSLIKTSTGDAQTVYGNLNQKWGELIGCPPQPNRDPAMIVYLESNDGTAFPNFTSNDPADPNRLVGRKLNCLVSPDGTSPQPTGGFVPAVGCVLSYGVRYLIGMAQSNMDTSTNPPTMKVVDDLGIYAHGLGPVGGVFDSEFAWCVGGRGTFNGTEVSGRNLRKYLEMTSTFLIADGTRANFNDGTSCTTGPYGFHGDGCFGSTSTGTSVAVTSGAGGLGGMNPSSPDGGVKGTGGTGSMGGSGGVGGAGGSGGTGGIDRYVVSTETVGLHVAVTTSGPVFQSSDFDSTVLDARGASRKDPNSNNRQTKTGFLMAAPEIAGIVAAADYAYEVRPPIRTAAQLWNPRISALENVWEPPRYSSMINETDPNLPDNIRKGLELLRWTNRVTLDCLERRAQGWATNSPECQSVLAMNPNTSDDGDAECDATQTYAAILTTLPENICLTYGRSAADCQMHPYYDGLVTNFFCRDPTGEVVRTKVNNNKVCGLATSISDATF
jgi:hypothetical protein